jgi:hypothetical protein
MRDGLARKIGEIAVRGQDLQPGSHKSGLH